MLLHSWRLPTRQVEIYLRDLRAMVGSAINAKVGYSRLRLASYSTPVIRSNPLVSRMQSGGIIVVRSLLFDMTVVYGII